MIKNSTEEFSNSLFHFITSGQTRNKNALIRKHTENLSVNGDFSFPISINSWHSFIKTADASEFFKKICEDESAVKNESQKWPYQIEKTKTEKERMYLFINRQCAIPKVITEAVQNITVFKARLAVVNYFSCVLLDPQCINHDDLTTLRLKCLGECIENLIKVSGKTFVPDILISWIENRINFENARFITCGAVLNAKTGQKETTRTGEDYICMRQGDMSMIAEHKYGVRVTTDSQWKKFIEHLGESAVVFELLEMKPTSAVKIVFDSVSHGTSKGASFILYNCARLETLIRTFNDKVREGVYPELPPLPVIDFSLLNQEDEWALIFNYIAALPTLITDSVDDDSCEFRPHIICNFLSSLVRVFSQYYRRTRVLTEARAHLLPVLYARIHMLMVLNDTLKLCLRILNIKSVTQM